ncbi:MAG: hypothetical protein OHK006_13000 [Thermodesulfovibrionales bacterium]
MNWLDDLRIEDLPETYREMAGIIGLGHTLKLAQHYTKQGFYFRDLDEIVSRKKAEYIRAHFNGCNHRELARATGYSERWVYEILKNGKDDRQDDLFCQD